MWPRKYSLARKYYLHVLKFCSLSKERRMKNYYECYRDEDYQKTLETYFLQVPHFFSPSINKQQTFVSYANHQWMKGIEMLRSCYVKLTKVAPRHEKLTRLAIQFSWLCSGCNLEMAAFLTYINSIVNLLLINPFVHSPRNCQNMKLSLK